MTFYWRIAPAYWPTRGLVRQHSAMLVRVETDPAAEGWLLHRVIRVLCPVQIGQSVIHFIHADTFRYRANQVAEITTYALIINHRIGTLAIIVFGRGYGLV